MNKVDILHIAAWLIIFAVGGFVCLWVLGAILSISIISKHFDKADYRELKDDEFRKLEEEYLIREKNDD